MTVRARVDADDLAHAVEVSAATLDTASDGDWSRRAGTLSWDCWHTAAHLSDVLVSYAAQLAARASDGWVGFATEPDPGASPEVLTEVVDAAGNLLVAEVRCTPSDTRAYHALGTIGPEAFAAMGAAELLLHTDDIATGVGVRFVPAEELCRPILDRLFPDVDAAGAGAWTSLRWAMGRTEVAGRPAPKPWRYHVD
ncbi:MAG TPA: maleylpyruvate isomerase N-terminal domain-containing protein [Acidimicrobiia bacterium]|nr:maleylpyruvate isomerase N-terminal domain-containing protein [Acidimicrobiia bacterium]